MKQTFFLLAFFSTIIFSACSKKDNNPTPPPNSPTVIPDTLSVGWTKVTTGITSGITDVFFTNSSSGFLTSFGGIYKSIDGGINWALYQSNNNAYNIGGLGNKFCFVGQDNTINYSTNGTNYYTQSYYIANPINSQTLGFRDCFISSANIFYACSGRYIYKSINGGNTFDSVYVFPEGSINNSIFFTNDTNGWLCRTIGLYKTIDGGINWTLNLNYNTSNLPGAVDFISANIGIVSAGGNVLKTMDGGVNWTTIYSSNFTGVIDVDMISATEMYISANSKIYKSIDGGVNFTQVLSSGQNGITEIHFIDANTGWACGANGAIYRYKL